MTTPADVWRKLGRAWRRLGPSGLVAEAFLRPLGAVGGEVLILHAAAATTVRARLANASADGFTVEVVDDARLEQVLRDVAERFPSRNRVPANIDLVATARTAGELVGAYCFRRTRAGLLGEGVVVAEAHRGRGIALLLLSAAAERTTGEIRVATAPHNRAMRRVLAKAGFAPVQLAARVRGRAVGELSAAWAWPPRDR